MAVCPDFKATGLDKKLRRRYTTGGRDDRRCKRCNGEGRIDTIDDKPARRTLRDALHNKSQDTEARDSETTTAEPPEGTD